MTWSAAVTEQKGKFMASRRENLLTSYYALRKYNFNTGELIEVHREKVRGRANAEMIVDQLNQTHLTPDEQEAGISWYHARTPRP